MSKHIKYIQIFFLISVVFATFFLPRPKTHASISSCTVSVSPTSITTSTSGQFSFSVTNGGSTTALWVQITRPTASYTVTAGSGSGWGVQQTSSQVTYVDGTLTAGSSGVFNVNVTSGSSGESSQNWTITMSDSSTGTPATTCTGSSGTAIAGSPNVPVTISNLAVADVTSSQVKVTFTTSRSATSVLNYGTTKSYGSTSSITGATTSHSYTVSNLNSNTTYYYQAVATDSDSNVARTSTTNSFNTALPGATAAPTATTAPVAPTATPTPDTKPPVVTLNQIVSKSYKTSPIISGTAADDAAVASVEYTTDNGKSWNRITKATDLNTSLTQFQFTPTNLKTGMYEVKVRAKDSSGNAAVSLPIILAIDQTGPTILLTTSFKEPYKQAPKVTGIATDTSGESAADYSLDGGKNWQPVDKIIHESDTVTKFEFTPPPLDDGNYFLQIRATDPLGNQSVSELYTLVIDRLPPRLGGMLLRVGPQQLIPRGDGTIITLPDIEHTISLSVIGGPTTVTLFVTDERGKTFSLPLQRHTDTNVWSTSFALPHNGRYRLRMSAIDGAGNKTEKTFLELLALPKGNVTNEAGKKIAATVTLFTFDQTSDTFLPWDAAPFGQQNPVRITGDTGIGFLPPPGKYYIEVAAVGYRTIQTTTFTVPAITPIISSFTVKKAPSLSLLLFTLPLPELSRETQILTLANSLDTLPYTQVNFPIPSLTLSGYSLSNLRGKESILTMANTWDPQTPSQMEELERLASLKKKNIVVIFPHESQSVVTLFKERGSYTLPMIADPDGELGESIPYRAIPTHYAVSKEAKVQTQMEGTRSAEELIGL